MKHHWTLRLGAMVMATISALCTLPACGDESPECINMQRPVSSCFPWPEADACPADTATILQEVRKLDPDHDYVSVPFPTGLRNSDNPPQCCYRVDMNYIDCRLSRPTGT